MKKLYLLLVTICFILIACESGGITGENEPTDVPKIELSTPTIKAEFEPVTHTVQVTSPYSWEAESKNDWIVVNNKTGIAGTKDLKFSVERNEELEVREGTIVVSNRDYNLVAEFYVIQSAFVPAMTVAPETLTFTMEGGAQNVEIAANFDYEVTPSADWVTCTKTESGLTLTVPEYVEVEERTATVTISSEKYDVSQNITVTQAAFVPAVTVDPETLTFTAEGGVQDVKISANFDYEVIPSADWVTYTKTESGLTLTVPEYVEVEERTATVTISSEKYDVSQNITVTQSAFVPEFTIDTETLTFTADGGAQDVKISANFDYEVTPSADWVTYTKTESGLTLTVPEYVEVEERTATVTISSEKYDVSQNITVTQSAFVPEFTIDTETLTFTADGGAQDVKISANFDYEVTPSADWVTYTKTESGLTLTVPKWVEVYDRTISVTISNEKYGISTSIKVTQKLNLNSNRIICYTSSDGKVVTPYNENAFGANIVSNTYSEGMGIIVFDGGITSIRDKAFYYCNSLTSVTIPNSVTSIGSAAFYDCSLQTVTIPNSVTSIGDYAFCNCNSLTSVTIPNSVTSIGDYAFCNCNSLTSVTIPNSVTSIGDYAFYDCSSLTGVTIPDNVTSIGDAAFMYCRSLSAFYGKYTSLDNRCLIVDGVLNSFAPAKLTEYTIPDGVTSIGDWAFRDCSSLTSVTIPNSVTSIGYGAFEDCSSLTSVYCKPIRPPKGGGYILNGNSSERKIYVPTQSVSAYKASTYWKDYANAIVGYDFTE